tara:strand:+ start:1255 stop:2703 length:1449 start_codon:yes stop_codon:yes gene_type:complete
MKEIEKIAEDLFDKIRTRFEDVSLGDSKAKATTNPEDARFFNFDYMSDGENYGNITISIADDASLKIYFSRNISENIPANQRKQWYTFLQNMRFFAKRNMMTFDTRDISRNNLSQRDIKTISKSDAAYTTDDISVTEGKMYGSTKSSYEKMGPVRIVVKHTGKVDENIRGSRTRKIGAVFVENSEGERLKLPFVNLAGARAMARHMQNGGTMSDSIGEHITTLVTEMNDLRVFVRNMRGKTFEDTETNQMVESAIEYYGTLHEKLHKMKGQRTYKRYAEEYTPEEIDNSKFDEAALRERFTKRLFDDRMNSALGSVYKAYMMKQQEVPETALGNEFQSWADEMVEGTWATPDSDNKVEQLKTLFAKPLMLGADATNAIGAMYDIIGDDKLFDDLAAAAEINPDGDANPIIVKWIKMYAPELEQSLGLTTDNELEEVVDRYDQQADFVDDVAYDDSEEVDPEEKSAEEESLELQFIKKLSGIK